MPHSRNAYDGRRNAGVAKKGAIAGLCPITEANLGDGTFSAVEFLKHGGTFGIGSDSNVLIGVGEELRQLEYSQRLSHRARNVIAPANGSTGRTLFDGALTGGAKALGVKAGIAAGNAADFSSLNVEAAPYLQGDDILDGWIFGNLVKPRDVWIGGKPVVRDGAHIRRDEIAGRFQHTMRQLLSV